MPEVDPGLRFIYGLFDPLHREIRYVGYSTVGMKRPQTHLYESVYLNPKNYHRHVYAWIRSVYEAGRKPQIVIIEYQDDRTIQEMEVSWISFFREIGCDLTNCTDGGDGASFPGDSNPSKRADVRAKNSASHLGKSWKPRDEKKWKENLSKGGRGKPKSLEHRRKISKSRREKNLEMKGLS